MKNVIVVNAMLKVHDVKSLPEKKIVTNGSSSSLLRFGFAHCYFDGGDVRLLTSFPS